MVVLADQTEGTVVQVLVLLLMQAELDREQQHMNLAIPHLPYTPEAVALAAAIIPRQPCLDREALAVALAVAQEAVEMAILQLRILEAAAVALDAVAVLVALEDLES